MFASGPTLGFGQPAEAIGAERFAASTELPDAVKRLADGLAPGRAPLLLGVLPREDGDLVIAVLDHLVCDAEALDVLFAKLADSYAALKTGGAQLESSAAPSFAAFLAKRRQQEQVGHDAALRHWRRVFDRINLNAGLSFSDEAGREPGEAPQAVRIGAGSQVRQGRCRSFTD